LKEASVVSAIGEWTRFGAGTKVLCPGTREDDDRRHLPRSFDDRRNDARKCKRVFLHVGRGKIIRVRVVGNRRTPVPSFVNGHTHLCHECGTIFEVEELPAFVAQAS
jgi:hypothetical protein